MRHWYARATTLFEQEVARSMMVYAYAPFAKGHLHLVTGDWEQGSQSLARAIALFEQNGNLHVRRAAQRELAEAELLRGHAVSARARLDPVLSETDRMEESDVTALLPFVAWAQAETGAEDQAQAVVARAIAQAASQHHELALIDALSVQALLAVRRGRWQEAEYVLNVALARCRAMPYPYAEAKVLAIYGQLWAFRGEPARARTSYALALAILQRLGEGLYQPGIGRALAELEGEHPARTGGQGDQGA
jgi:hypothetical protein